MGNLGTFLLVLVSSFALQGGLVVGLSYRKMMSCNWGCQNVNVSGRADENLSLTLNNYTGSGIQTKKQYLFGSFEMSIKLVPNNSAGTVTTYYISSLGPFHDEVDFEFLGNVSGQPYIIHTNLYAEGQGNREQQFYPWFNPTTGYHNYTIFWSPSQIVWFVDGIPIRIFKNYKNIGVPFPHRQPMRAYSSLWNADNWATQGGLVKIDWKSAPFVARYRGLNLRACTWAGNISKCTASNPANLWTNPAITNISYAQIGQLNWVRRKYMIYDYCKDTKRFNGQMAPECSQPIV